MNFSVTNPVYSLQEINDGFSSLLVEFPDDTLAKFILLGRSKFPGGLHLDNGLEVLRRTAWQFHQLITVDNVRSSRGDRCMNILTGCTKEFGGCSIAFESPDVMSGVSIAILLASTDEGEALIDKIFST